MWPRVLGHDGPVRGREDRRPRRLRAGLLQSKWRDARPLPRAHRRLRRRVGLRRARCAVGRAHGRVGEDADGRPIPSATPTWANSGGLATSIPAGSPRQGRRARSRGRSYYTERSKRTLCTLADGSVSWKDELADDTDVIDQRDVIEKQIRERRSTAAIFSMKPTGPVPTFPSSDTSAVRSSPTTNSAATKDPCVPRLIQLGV